MGYSAKISSQNQRRVGKVDDKVKKVQAYFACLFWDFVGLCLDVLVVDKVEVNSSVVFEFCCVLFSLRIVRCCSCSFVFSLFSGAFSLLPSGLARQRKERARYEGSCFPQCVPSVSFLFLRRASPLGDCTRCRCRGSLPSRKGHAFRQTE